LSLGTKEKVFGADLRQKYKDFMQKYQAWPCLIHEKQKKKKSLIHETLC